MLGIRRQSIVVAVTAAAILAIALVAASSVFAEQRGPGLQKARLSAGVAKAATAAWLGRRYDNAWYNRSGASLRCGKRVAFNARKCSFGFVIGDSGWYGEARVSLFRGEPGDRRARVRYRVHHINEYCVFGEGRSPEECTTSTHGTARLEFFLDPVTH